MEQAIPTPALIGKALERNRLTLTDGQTELLAGYLDELLRVNTYMNLTAIRDPSEGAVKHIADCLLCASLIPENASLLDIGSGAGLPAFPFAIARPDITVTALDSTAKKVGFIRDTASLLGLTNLHTLTGRAEELALSPDYREKFTAVSARAVARMNILCELSLPFLAVGGTFIAMKSRLAPEELKEAEKGILQLGGQIGEPVRFTLLGGDEPGERYALILRKVKPTPAKYPRPYGKISAKPLS